MYCNDLMAWMHPLLTRVETKIKTMEELDTTTTSKEGKHSAISWKGHDLCVLGCQWYNNGGLSQKDSDNWWNNICCSAEVMLRDKLKIRTTLQCFAMVPWPQSVTVALTSFSIHLTLLNLGPSDFYLCPNIIKFVWFDWI